MADSCGHLPDLTISPFIELEQQPRRRNVFRKRIGTGLGHTTGSNSNSDTLAGRVRW